LEESLTISAARYKIQWRLEEPCTGDSNLKNTSKLFRICATTNFMRWNMMLGCSLCEMHFQFCTFRLVIKTNTTTDILLFLFSAFTLNLSVLSLIMMLTGNTHLGVSVLK